MKLFVLSVWLCLSLSAQLTIPQPTMNNSTVASMLRRGVPIPSILAAIKSAPDADFLVNNYEAGQLVRAGASDRGSDQILEAMHQRMARGAATNSSGGAEGECGEEKV